MLCVLDVVDDEAISSLFLLIITLFVLFTNGVFLASFDDAPPVVVVVAATLLGTLSDWLPMLLLLLAIVLLREGTGRELFEIFDTSDMMLVLLENAVRPSRDLYTRPKVLFERPVKSLFSLLWLSLSIVEPSLFTGFLLVSFAVAVDDVVALTLAVDDVESLQGVEDIGGFWGFLIVPS